MKASKTSLVLLCSILATAGCGPESDKSTAAKNEQNLSAPVEFADFQMAMKYRILIGQNLSTHEINEIQKIIDKAFVDVDLHFNHYNPNSELSRFNALKAGETIEISQELAQLLDLTQKAYDLSHGRFDPSVRPLLLLWKASLERQETPALEDLARVSRAIGFDKLQRSGNMLTKPSDLYELDCSGIAKGLAVDWLSERLLAAGYTNTYVEWGGEIRTHGQHPAERPWTVFVSNLGSTDPSQAAATIELFDEALATSGDYFQYWTVPGTSETYFHIIDPKTKEPLRATKNSIASVTVKAKTCAMADAFATAGMIFASPDQALAWIQEIQAIEEGVDFTILARSMEKALVVPDTDAIADRSSDENSHL